MEYALGDELVTLVERGEDENATHIIAQVIQQLHSVSQSIPHDAAVGLGLRLKKSTGGRHFGSICIPTSKTVCATAGSTD